MSNFEMVITFMTSLSLIVSIIALLYSTKDKPSFMPNGNTYKKFLNVSLITLLWTNASDKTIDDLTVLFNFYNSNLDEITTRKIEDKYNFGIVGKSNFNYSFSDFSDLRFFRVGFCGKYNGIFLFNKKYFKQHIWYTASPIVNDGIIIDYDFHTTYKEELKRIQDRDEQKLKDYEKAIDIKFKQ